MNFEIIDDKRFRVNGNVIRRLYKVKHRPNGNLQLINAKDGSILFDNLVLAEIQANGTTATIDILEEITFKNDCQKRNRRTISKLKKIFDSTFDKTFE